MKKIILLTALLLSGIILPAQMKLSPQKIQKAQKKAVAEARMYSKKGFKPYGSSLEMQQLIKNFYLDVYKENSPGERTYVWAMGMGKAKNKEKAYPFGHVHLVQAKKHKDFCGKKSQDEQRRKTPADVIAGRAMAAEW